MTTISDTKLASMTSAAARRSRESTKSFNRCLVEIAIEWSREEPNNYGNDLRPEFDSYGQFTGSYR